MKRKILLVSCSVLAVSAFVVGLAACGGDNKNAAPPENEYLITYRSDWQGANDADMNVDGSLSEARWKNKKWFTTCAPYDSVGEGAWLETTAFTTEYGLYIGAILHDDNIVGDGEFNVTQATCLEYHYTFRQADGKLYNVSYGNRGRFFLDVFGNYCTKGERMKRGVQVDGVVNSGNTKTATFEVFIPWEEAGVEVTEDWYPEEAYVLPQCRIVAEGETYSRCTLGFISERWRCDYLAMYYEFDENGYTKADAEGAVLGDAKNGFAKSAGWNLDKLADGEVSLDKAYEYDYIFFRNAYAKNFEATMKIYPGEYYRDLPYDNGINYETNGLTYNTDGRSGFYLLLSTGQEFIPYLEYNNLVDSKEDGVKVPVNYHLRSLDNFVSAWHVSDDICNFQNTEKAGAVEFRMIKYGSDLFYFADGIYLGTQRVDALNDSVYVGIYNNSRASTYKDYDFKAYTDDEVKAVLDENEIYAVTVGTQSGGTVECEQNWVKQGDKIVFKAICESGYEIDQIMLGTTDVTDSCKDGVQRYGKYSVAADQTANVSVTFKELAEGNYSTVTGMVYSGNDEKPTGATLKFACQTDASVVYTVRATSAKGYSVSLPDGKYSVFVTFGSKDASTQEIVVNGNATQDIRSMPLNVETGSIKITDDGYFATEYSETNTRCYLDTVESGKPFVMEATIKDMSDKTWPSVGFIISTGGDHWLKFILRLACPNEGEYYDTLIWHDDYVNDYYVKVVNFEDENLRQNPFTGEGDTAKLRLVYSGRFYYFYVNDSLIFKIDQDDRIQGDNPATVASTLSSGDVSLGLFAERQITFTQWNTSSAYDDVFNVIGKTVTAESGFELTVNGNAVENGKVLLGDEVTVTATTEGNFTFLLDGEMIATTVKDGKATATFTVTDDCSLTYTIVYAVSGTVKNGDEDTAITIANESGTVVYRGNTDANGAFTADLANGTYYAVATSATKMSDGTVITVNGSSVSGVAVAFAKPIISDWTFTNNYAVDYPTGGYTSTDEHTENGGWFAGITAQSDTVYLLEADLKDMGTQFWTDAGFTVGTNENRLCFTVQYNIENATYRFVLWRKPGDPIVGQNVENPFASGSMNVKLLYANRMYYFYVNEALIYSNSELSVGDNVRVGLFNERKVTFTDWNYTEGRDVAQSYIGKELTVDSGMEIKVNGVTVTPAGDKVNVLLGDEITVSITPEQGQTLSITVDGNGVTTETVEGKAVATFTVTDDHAIGYSVSYAVTGTVTGSDENTVVTVASANGGIIGESKGASFAFNVPNGTYYVCAHDASKLSEAVSVTVQDEAVSAGALTLTKPTLTAEEGRGAFALNGFGQYTTKHDELSNRAYFGTVDKGDSFTLEATMKDMGTTEGPSAGVILSTGGNHWVRFVVARMGNDFKVVIWRNLWDTGDYFGKVFDLSSNPFGEDNSGLVTLKLVVHNGLYAIYVNGTEVGKVTENDAFDNGNTIAGALGDGQTISLGVTAERDVTFTDWKYATGREAVKAYFEKMLTVGSGVEVKVNGEAATLTEGKVQVLLGDEITVSVALAQGQTLSFTVDGNGITTETVEGKAVATFTVTKDHAVSYSASYAITGTVTGGDENTAVTLVNANGVKVGESTGANFSFTVADGTYYVCAQSATMLSNIATVTVNGAAATAETIAFEKQIINEWMHPTNRYAIDYKTGAYCSAADQNQNGGWFAGINVQESSAYVLETTAKDMPTPADQYPSAGFMVGTGESWLRYTVQWDKDNSTYRFVLWRSSGAPDVGANIESPFADGEMALRLVYANNNYYFYVNGKLVYTALDTSFGGKVGLFNDWRITFTDWGYTEGRDATAKYIGKTVTATGFDLSVGGNAVTDGKVLLGDVVAVSVNAQPNGLFLVDGNMISTSVVDGKSVATFTVTGDHIVTYTIENAVISGTVSVNDGELGAVTVKVSNASGELAWLGTAETDGSFTTDYLASGTYYIVAENATHIGSVQITVNSGETPSPVTITLSKFKLQIDAGSGNVDYKGNYQTVQDDTNNRAYFATVAKGTSFTLEATMKGMGDGSQWPSSGFILWTGENSWIKFVVRNGAGNHDIVVWRNIDGELYCATVANFSDDASKANPFTGTDGTLNFKLVYENGNYTLFVNGTQVFQIGENVEIQNGHTVAGILGDGNVKLGLFGERQITFTDWKFTANETA